MFSAPLHHLRLIINQKSTERTGKVEDKSKILRTAPIDMAIVRTNFLTWKMKVRSAANGFSSWEDVSPNEPEKQSDWTMDSKRGR
jgi:hypothetical protein